MKSNYLTYAVFSLALMLGVTACSDDDTLVKPEPSPVVVPELPESPELNVGIELFDLKKGTSKSQQIVSGAGEYRVDVLDPAIAAVTLEGNSLTVEGLEVGETDIVVSDGGGSYKSVKVNVYKSDVVSLSTERLDLVLKMGAAALDSFSITDGNAPYNVISSNPDIVSVELDEDGVTVSVTGLAEGEATVTVTDSRNLTATLVVSNTVQDTPFSDEELEEIKSQPVHTYVVNGTKITKYQLDQSGYDDIMWSMYIWGALSAKSSYDNLYVFSKTNVDMSSVGKKEGLCLCYSVGSTTYISRSDAVDAHAEVIKVEDGKAWITFYAEKDILYSGYLVVKL